ncbi:hypothetical protein MNBD_DELTA02-211 [hydrothermal vent metagenome]|uniref:SCP2 domain-containing protein n=1 Tax=hydrothermal vent metagenome TaxID=652676 RepID=A0A3B0VJ06_9ZZZZ
MTEEVDEIKNRLRARAIKAASPMLRLMPLWMEALGAGVFISHVLSENPQFARKLDGLEGKIFLFEATDIKKRFHLVIKDNDIKVVPHLRAVPDVTMRGEVKILAELLLGKIDPDTVFFSRQLEINGDTSAAILFKNLLANL